MAFSDPQKNIEQFGLSEGMSVADLGAGVGAYTIAAVKAVGNTGRVYAVEVQKDFLQNIKEAISREGIDDDNVEVIRGDIERIGKTKIDDGIIDAAIVSNVLFQMEDKQGFLNELKRILKYGGRVLVVDWEDSFGGMGPHKDHIVSYSNARELFESENFNFIKDISAGDHHWGFVVER
jgi:ubiquinone/menaquinone biosynthesis C-methylase UbiE